MVTNRSRVSEIEDDADILQTLQKEELPNIAGNVRGPRGTYGSFHLGHQDEACVVL